MGKAASPPRPSVPGALLETRKLCRSFGGVKANQDVDLVVPHGRIVSLIGPNGAGKTTTFNAITGVYPPTGGEVWLYLPEGPRRLDGLSINRICELGVARTFQNIHLFTDLPVIDNVKVGLHARTRKGLVSTIVRTWSMLREEDEIHAAALRYLDFVGLAHLAHECATSLAYGDQRRLEIARALATHPKVLLLDEPAAGMNPTETVSLVALIRRIRACGVTVLLIEHDMKLVMEISDDVFVMDHGCVIAHGPPEAVQRDPKVIEAYLGVQEEEAPHAGA